MTPSLRDRFRAGEGGTISYRIPRGVKKTPAPVQAGKKPWPEHDKAPWGDGDPDGEDHGAHQVPPGEEAGIKPNPEPEGDHANMRSVVGDAAMHLTLSNPDVFNAMLAIEARLGEISLYLPIAMRGLPVCEARGRLEFLQQII